MLIPEATIKEIIDKADIVAIIGEHIPLSKKGNDYKGICPFHDDNNPSLSVSPSRKIYKCFSCGASGNVITFIQNFKHVSFVEAAKYVGAKCGIEIKGVDNAPKKFANLYSCMDDACKFYEFYLRNSKEGVEGINYLKNRKLDDDVIKRFRIGLASKEDDLLYKTLTQGDNQHLPVDLIKCGLIRSLKNDKYVDAFKERIIFPITNLEGEIVGFSGRLYNKEKDDNNPKYFNTSENDIFKKGNILYNYSYAMNDIKTKNRVYIFEGFMDVIAAYRSGVFNTVATMGTALTQNHINALKKLTNNIVLCFDGDGAGILATKRSINIFIKAGMDVKVMLLPEGLDPDEYLDKYGKDSLKDFLENKPISSFEYLYSLEKRELNQTDISSINNFKKNIFEYVKLFNSKTIEATIINMIANDLNIDSESIKSDLEKYLKEQENVSSHNEPYVPAPNVNEIFSYEDNLNDFVEIKKNKKRINIKKTKYINSEQALIYFSLKKKDYCNKVASLLPFGNNIYVEKINRDIFWTIHDYYKLYQEIDYERFYNWELVTDEMRAHLDVIMRSPSLCEETIVISFLEECARNVTKYSSEINIDKLNKNEEKNLEELKNLTDLKKNTIRIINKKDN